MAKCRISLALESCARGFDSHRPLHFSLSGVSLRCPRTRLSLSPSSHSLDAATTVPLIECVDRPLDRTRSLLSHSSIIDPLLVRANVCFLVPNPSCERISYHRC